MFKTNPAGLGRSSYRVVKYTPAAIHQPTFMTFNTTLPMCTPTPWRLPTANCRRPMRIENSSPNPPTAYK
eukprot:365733-Chlamydomonas_euryale.AAC.35